MRPRRPVTSPATARSTTPIDRDAYEVQLAELRLLNKRDGLKKMQAATRIEGIQVQIADLQLQIMKADKKMEQRDKQIAWLEERLNG